MSDSKVGIRPRSSIARILMPVYIATDVRTGAVATESFSCGLLLSFCLHLSLFIAFQGRMDFYFYCYNLLVSIFIPLVASGYGIFRFGFNKTNHLTKISLYRSFLDVLAKTAFIVVSLAGVYIAAFKKTPHNPFDIFFIFVVFNTPVTAMNALSFSCIFMNIIRFFAGEKNGK